MYERNGDSADITFQWVIGDTRALEKNLGALIAPQNTYAITIVTRLVAYALTFLVAYLFLPGADFFVVLLIAMAGSFSLWASVWMEIMIYRALERFRAEDPLRVGWNSVLLDASGITWSTELSLEYVSWMGVSEVVEREGSLWMKTGPANGYYLPGRVFSSREESVDCFELIERLRQQPLPPKHISEQGEDLVMH